MIFPLISDYFNLLIYNGRKRALFVLERIHIVKVDRFVVTFCRWLSWL